MSHKIVVRIKVIMNCRNYHNSCTYSTYKKKMAMVVMTMMVEMMEEEKQEKKNRRRKKMYPILKLLLTGQPYD